MQQEGSTRSSQASVSAAIAAANSAFRDIPVKHAIRPDSGRSLADMAERDLDAALQLLSDRAQYITGSHGAAIALRRTGSNDMLCRASSGSNAPELGTLLSTEFGLSGESVRTRRALRCDDAERDARVNRDICRAVGIASVAVMPVVHDDEVLGVFELFSSRAHAFGERDMSALQRLSEMVETAVRLAQAAEGIPERWASAGVSSGKESAEVLEAHDLVIEDPLVEVEAEAAGSANNDVAVHAATGELARAAAVAATVSNQPAQSASVNATSVNPASASSASAGSASAKRSLYWTAATSAANEAAQPAASDKSHVPPVLRHLKKCEACGFPVSTTRTLCVECEEKKWRGQLKPRAAAAPTSASGSAVAAAPALDVRNDIRQAVADNILRMTTAAPASATPSAPIAPVKEEKKVESKIESSKIESKISELKSSAAGTAAQPKASVEAVKTEKPSIQAADQATDSKPAQTQMAPPTLSFGMSLEPPQSWFAKNKYILGAMLLIGATIAAILLLR